jgi:hypothetical protein
MLVNKYLLSLMLSMTVFSTSFNEICNCLVNLCMRLKKINRCRKHRNYCGLYFGTVKFVVEKKMCLIAKMYVVETGLTSSPKHLIMSMSVGLI